MTSYETVRHLAAVLTPEPASDPRTFGAFSTFFSKHQASNWLLFPTSEATVFFVCVAFA
ncbi:hypothetical protein K443DRAFT_679333 [Laccaria amethystina LaAM-08-1]|uniref:Uncharacterized protein n=1 Tax=Laccaria amethystina LaAM-08-1 TaxID=1095629 RepID=A0A0C9XRA1_9AGAR|nr:hypothetical protein K443DRAFT_679333 [Laccaria amethystina LaAM-08-1]